MASKKEVQRVISGRMHLLPPPDKINPDDALHLVNFRSDTMNRLVARGGSVKEFGPIGSGRFHTIAHGNGYIYNGIGEEIYYGRIADTLVDGGYDGNPMSFLGLQGQVFVMNQGRQSRLVDVITRRNWGVGAPATAPTATGGGQLQTTIEPYDGSTGQNTVIVAAPGARKLVHGVADDAAMVKDAPTPGLVNPSYCDPHFLSVVGRNSLALSINQPCRVKAVIEGNFNSTFSGLAQDDDVFRFWVNVSDPSLVNSFAVSMTDSAGGYVEVVFQPSAAYGGTFFPPSKFLAQSPGSWAQIVIKRSVNLDDWSARVAAVVADPTNQQAVSDIESQYAAAVTSPAFAYIGRGSPQTGLPVPPASASRLPFNWAAIAHVIVSFDVTDACTVNLNQFEVIGTISANISGSVQYYVSFVNESNQDGNPSPPSNPVILGNQSVTLSGVAVSADPQVVKRYVWRIGGGLSQALQVGIIPDNVTTTFSDNSSNEAAQDLGIYMPINRDPVPPASGCVGPFYGKVLAWNTKDHPARLFWSPSQQPWFFPGSNDDAVGNWEDVGADDDAILCVILHPTLAVIYKQRSIWRMPGDPATNDAVQTDSTFGLAGPRAAVNYGSVDFIVSNEGVYRYNLDFGEKISTDIDPIFKGDFVLLQGTGQPGDVYLPPLQQSKISNCVLSVTQDRLRLSYTSWFSEVNDTVAIYHIPSGRWSLESYDHLPQSGFAAMIYGGLTGDGLERTLMGGLSDVTGAFCYRLEQQRAIDDGGYIVARWQTPFYDQGLPDNPKWYSDVELEFWTQYVGGLPTSVDVFLLLDNGERQITLGVGLVMEPRGTMRFSLRADQLVIPRSAVELYGLRAKNWALRVQADCGPGGLQIFGAYMHWWPEERQANTFDSGDTNLGIPERVKEIDYLEVYVTANGGTFEPLIASDLPGSVLTERTGWANLPAPVGRGNVRFRMPSGTVSGRNFRIQVDNSPNGQLFQLHQARVRGRVIGEYIDGTIGEYYESPEFSVAPGRVGELKDFLLDYDVSGTGGMMFLYSDLPDSNGLQIRRSLPIPYQGGARGVYVFPLGQQSDLSSDELPNGQLFKVRLYPPPGGILRLHGRATFRARVIGTYFNGANGEVWETQPDDIFGGLALLREGEVTLEAGGPMVVEILEELPNQDERVVASFIADPTPTTQGRLPIYGRFPGHTKGQMIKCRVRGPYICRLYAVRLFGRKLQTNATPWDWVNVPGLEPTPDNFSDISMPVRVTPEQFEWFEIGPDPIA